MCRIEDQEACKHPEKLKGKPEECTPEQIRECHGGAREHPCEPEKKVSHTDLERATSKGVL